LLSVQVQEVGGGDMSACWFNIFYAVGFQRKQCCWSTYAMRRVYTTQPT
jgi:hypothetical protein